ncbi:recombinase family protein [Bacillus sp. C1-1]|nr:recombinase family protein [Bacillus sp. C1-1]
MKVSYARVSTGLQNLDLQPDSLHSFGCEKIFVDKVSGARKKRDGLTEALEFIRQGDTLVVWRLDRLGRNMQELINVVNSLNSDKIDDYIVLGMKGDKYTLVRYDQNTNEVIKEFKLINSTENMIIKFVSLKEPPTIIESKL